MRVLEQRGVTLHLGAPPRRVESGIVRLSGGASVEADAIIWATGASAPSWPKMSGLATDDGGFVRVNRWLQSVSHPQVFAAGDIASVCGEPRPKSGVYAVRAGPPLAKNLRRMLRGEPLVEWTPQKDALALITTGDRYAVASAETSRSRANGYGIGRTGSTGGSCGGIEIRECRARGRMYSQLPLACQVVDSYR